MKIAVCRKKYTFHGGAEGFSKGFIDLLAKEGHEVHIYAIQWERDEAKSNIFFHRVPAVTFNSLLRDFTFAFLAKQQLEQEHYDIIQSHDKTLYQDIYRAGDGCHIAWLRQRWRRIGFLGKCSLVLNPYHWLILGLERSIFQGHRYRKIIAISEMVKRNIMDNYPVSSEDIAVIYNPVDLEKFHPSNRGRYRQEIRREYGLNESEFVVLFVGSGFERKGVRYLIEASELLDKKITVMVVGKGSGEKFRGIVRKQRVIFCGPQKQIEQYYAAADAFVFPTIYEPFGNVHLEALAAGLPVITTENSGASELIENNKSGFVVSEPEDTKAIAEGMARLLDQDVRDRMSKEARRVAEKFTFERHAAEIMQLYSDMMKDKQTSQRSTP
jgi:UDP-glucose:(heptosyl)LPS alpha-1,3-glucosyltransferase